MSLRTRLLMAIGYVLLVAIVAFEVPLAINTANRTDSEIRAQASAQADLLAVAAAEELDEGTAALVPLVETVANAVRGRVIIVNSRGRLVADSENEARGTDFSTRPEIEQALAGDRFQQRRESTDLGMEILATAAPMIRGEEIVGAVRITQSTEAQSRAVLDSVSGLVLIGLIVLGIGLIAAVVVAGQLSEPMRGMTRSTRRIAAGHLDERVEPSGSSEQVALAHSFNEMTERLTEALQSQREFVADASHQLRTPITGLRLRLEEAEAMLAAGGPVAAADAAGEIDAATGEIDRLSQVVTEMLTLSKIGERRSRPTRIELNRLADEAVQRWRGEAAQRRIELRARGVAAGSVLCPIEDAERALDALIENAIRYSPGETTVEVRVADDEIVVVDQGPGVAPEEAEAVFERFHRGSSGRAGPHGTGLGLAIARGLARSWGGDVSLEPGRSGGTEATLSFARLPATAPEEAISG
jgi:two-component system, OmpR family, sensor kinase